jgi:hypothetical protein
MSDNDPTSNDGAEDAGRKAGSRMASVDKSSRRSGNVTQAILNDEIEILPDKNLPHLDRGPVKAYAARSKGDSGGFPYFALVCEPYLVPRIKQAPQVAGIISPGLARLIASGVCYWPPAQSERYVFIYENSLGNPLLKPGVSGMGWKAEHVLQIVIKPMVNVMLDLRDMDIFHGSINPMNMFDGGASVVERVIFGDCLATPPGYTQPVVYETIERGMADPILRGRGTPGDDLYSFGVSLATILRHKDPMEGLSDEEIIKTKMDIGSYAALTGKERFTGAILELLRGLLFDDEAQRWTLDEVLSWLDGQRLSPKQPGRKIKAARPLNFINEKYFQPQLLAMDLPKNQAEAVQLVETDTLNQWLERSLEDKHATARLEQAVATALENGRGPGYWDRLTARTSIALDPSAPIRFKGLCVSPEGFAAGMAEAMIRKKDPQAFVDIINQQLVAFWATIQTDGSADVVSLLSRFDSSRAFLRQPTLGYGIERCLYFLCQEAPCISETLKGYYVRSPEDIVYALEEIAKKPNRPHLFIDRHIAAFLSVKDRRVIDPFLTELNAPEFHKRILGNLKVIASLQKRSKMDGLPGVAAWAMDIVSPIYERYHDRDLREKLKARVSKIADSGDLSRIAGLLDDPVSRQDDTQGFKNAMRQYTQLRNELGTLDHDLSRPDTYGRSEGQQYASMASAVIAMIIIIAVIFIHFSHHSVF